MKLVLRLLAAALAHASPRAHRATVTQALAPNLTHEALACIRIPIGEGESCSNPLIGFGVFTDCARIAVGLSPARRSACEARPVGSLETSQDLCHRDWLISFSGAKR